MRTILLLIISILTATQAISQSTVPELKNLLSMDDEDAETYLLKKGFKFVGASEPDDNNGLAWTRSYQINSPNARHVALVKYQNGHRAISYGTRNVDEYLAARKYCKDSKMISGETEVKGEPQMVSYNYSDSVWKVIITTGADSNTNTLYFITVTKLPK